MPTTRKSRILGGPTSKSGQKTLTFNGQHKVTKPIPASAKDTKTTISPVQAKKIADEVTEIDVGSITSEKAIAAQAEVEKKVLKRTPEEEKALKVSDAQIKRYWKAREEDRLAPRVHQKGLSVEEKILRLFDITSTYGPCIGIARMKRWVRANKLGLNPPIEVLAVLLKEEGKGNLGIERAYVDELMGSKGVIGGDA